MNKSQNLNSRTSVSPVKVQIVGRAHHLSRFLVLLGFLFFTSALLHFCSSSVYATSQTSQSVSFTLEDRDRLIRLEATLSEFMKLVDKRFESMDKRIDQLFTFLWIITGIFISITIATISFAIWDRRTMIRPFEIKVREIEAIQEIDKGKIEKLILSLREIAKSDKKVEGILKGLNLL